RKPQGGRRAKALDHGRRGRARLDRRGLRRAHGASLTLERGARDGRDSAAVAAFLVAQPYKGVGAKRAPHAGENVGYLLHLSLDYVLKLGYRIRSLAH